MGWGGALGVGGVGWGGVGVDVACMGNEQLIESSSSRSQRMNNKSWKPGKPHCHCTEQHRLYIPAVKSPVVSGTMYFWLEFLCYFPFYPLYHFIITFYFIKVVTVTIVYYINVALM